MHVYKPAMSLLHASSWRHALEASTGRQQLLITQLARNSGSKQLLTTEGSTAKLMFMLQPQKLRGIFVCMCACACVRALCLLRLFFGSAYQTCGRTDTPDMMYTYGICRCFI